MSFGYIGGYEMEDIVWEDDEEVTSSRAIIDPNNDVVIGSRFDGMSMDDIPLWLSDMVTEDLILNINGVIYVYTSIETGWCPLRSAVTLSMLCRRLKVYAPVSYAQAAEPYVASIESVPWPMILMANTFTQGRLRYVYTVDLDTGRVEFMPNVIVGREVNSKNTLCAIPVSNVNPILKFNLRFKSVKARRNGALAWLYRVFGSNTIIVLWAIGDMLYDSSNKRMFILYGPGGVGKSTVANIINAIIGGTIPTLSPDLVCYNTKSFRKPLLSTDQFMKAASSRVVSLGDIEPKEGDVLHMQNIKQLTGGDEVNGMKIHTTLIMTANELLRYENLRQLIRRDRMRRLAVAPSVIERGGDDSDCQPLDQDSLDELVQFAVRTRIKHKRPPLTPDALLATLFQARYTEALEMVYIDETADLCECMEATMLLCWRFDVEVEELSNCLKCVGCCCAVKANDTFFIAKIKPLSGRSIGHLYDHYVMSSNKQWYNKQKRSNKANTPLFP